VHVFNTPRGINRSINCAVQQLVGELPELPISGEANMFFRLNPLPTIREEGRLGPNWCRSSPSPEGLLFKRIAEGDEIAFGKLYRKLGRILKSYIANIGCAKEHRIRPCGLVLDQALESPIVE